MNRGTLLPEGMAEEPSELVPAQVEGFRFSAEAFPAVMDVLRGIPEDVYRACTPIEPALDRQQVSDPIELLAAFGLWAHVNPVVQELKITGITGDWMPPAIMHCFLALVPFQMRDSRAKWILPA